MPLRRGTTRLPRGSYLIAAPGDGGRRDGQPEHYRAQQFGHLMRTDSQHGAGLDVLEAAAEHEPERGPLLLAQYPARIYAADRAQRRPLREATVPRWASGQLLAVPQDRLSQA